MTDAELIRALEYDIDPAERSYALGSALALAIAVCVIVAVAARWLQ